MGNDENWIRGLRQAARGYESAPPPGLWAELETDLRAAGVISGPSGFLRQRHLWWSAAAGFVVAAITLYIIICGIHSDIDGGALETVVKRVIENDLSLKPLIADAGDSGDAEPVLARTGQSGGALDVLSDGRAGDVRGDGYGYSEFSYYERIVVVGDGNDVTPTGNIRVSAAVDDRVSVDTVPAAVAKSPGKSIGGRLYATASPAKSPYGMPLGIGATVDIPVTDRLSVETGMEYSRIAVGGRADNYIGVPVRVNYDVYDGERVRFYASAGAAVEKSLNTRDLQVSLGAGVGLECSLDDSWGVFVEPGVEFYPGNGGEIPTIYKERTVAPEVRVGLRHTFGY